MVLQFAKHLTFHYNWIIVGIVALDKLYSFIHLLNKVCFKDYKRIGNSSQKNLHSWRLHSISCLCASLLVVKWI